jgi:hypothetical protein
MACCPTCGQTMPERQGSPSWLLDLLTNGQPHREVYHGRDGGWWVTYGGGEVSADAVRALVEGGHIVSVYSDCPKDAYHVGRTLDVARTMAERQKHQRRKDAPKIYVGDPEQANAGKREMRKVAVS